MSATEINAAGTAIISGPSKFDLMIALFAWKAGHAPVQFRLANGLTLNASILRVGCEDGSGESWIITGSAKSVNAPEQRQPQDFEAWFRTDTRVGRIRAVA